MEHCPKQWTSDGVQEFEAPISLDDARADEQLLVTLYSFVAGNEADEQILSVLSKYSEKYQSAALREKEFTFLCEHFDEVISYEFSHLNQWSVKRRVNRDLFSESLSLIREMVTFQKGQIVYIADADYCDYALLFPGCTVRGNTGVMAAADGLLEETWALGQIRLFAAGIKSEIVPGSRDDETGYHYYLSEDERADIIICNTFWMKEDFIRQLYLRLNPNGVMFLVTNRGCLAGNERMKSFRQQLVHEKAIHSIIQFRTWFIIVPHLAPMEETLVCVKRCINEEVQFKNTIFDYSIIVKADELDEDILWPGYYMAQRPQNGIPLSEIVSVPQSFNGFLRKGGNYQEKLKNMLIVRTPNLSEEYKYANVCFANLNSVNDTTLYEKSNSISDDSSIMIDIIEESSVLLYGNYHKLMVGYVTDIPTAGLATHALISCLRPKANIDVRYVAALLLSPIVRDQILTICDGVVVRSVLPLILDKIIVPHHSEKERLSLLAEENYKALVLLQQELKEEQAQYKKSVRMRKHALTQSLSSIEAMFSALNSYRIRKEGSITDDDVISRIKGTTVCEAFEFLSKNIKDMMPVLEHIADIEYTFSAPEMIDPEKAIENYISDHEKEWLNFKPIITWIKGQNQADEDLKDFTTGEVVLKRGDAMCQFLFPKDALERVFKNIVSNAQSHGFTDETRKDYMVKFSWYTNGSSLIIKIENNGAPIPSDRDTTSLLEYGVSTALHQNGHNGIGCNEIDDIMHRYNGDIKIISSPEKEFTVTYILSFDETLLRATKSEAGNIYYCLRNQIAHDNKVELLEQS